MKRPNQQRPVIVQQAIRFRTRRRVRPRSIAAHGQGEARAQPDSGVGVVGETVRYPGFGGSVAGDGVAPVVAVEQFR